MRRSWLLPASLLAVAACGRVDFDPLTDGGPTATRFFDLEVPIEMVSSAAPASDSTFVDFDRSLTHLRTTDYDGTVSYSFEIVAGNLDPPISVDLIARSTNAPVAQITLPTAGAPHRYRVPFVPPQADDFYTVRMGPAGGYRAAVYDSRLIVKQVGATRTRLYIPLVARSQTETGNQNGAVNGAADGVIAATPTQSAPERYPLWRKDASVFGGLATGTPWSFETLAYGIALDRPIIVELHDLVTDTAVDPATVTTISDQTTLQRGASTFANSALTDGHLYEVRFSGDEASYDTYLFKAGMWVTLDPIARGEVMYRVSGEQDGLAGPFDYARALIDLGAFSNPTTSVEATGAGGAVTLVDGGTDDELVGTGGYPDVPGATLTLGATKERQRAPVTLTSGHRYFVRTVNPTITLSSYWIVVGFTAR